MSSRQRVGQVVSNFAQLIKVYAAAPEGERRYSPAEVVSTEVVPVIGQPDPDKICTSHVERQNLTMRNADSPLHPIDQPIQQEVGEPQRGVRAVFRVLQFRADSQHASGYPLRWKLDSQSTSGQSGKCLVLSGAE